MEHDKKRTYGIYLLLILGGILLGWLLFGGGSDEHADHGHDHDHTEIQGSADVEYTCSMHPQVRQDEPGDCPICGMELISVSYEDDHLDADEDQ